MWILRQGFNKPSPAEASNARIFLGPVGRPVMIIRRRQIKYFLDEYFYTAYNVWWKYHLGMGFPYSGGWGEQPTHIVEIIETMEAEYKAIYGG